MTIAVDLGRKATKQTNGSHQHWRLHIVMLLVCKIAHELVGGLEPDLHGYYIGSILVTLP